MIIIDFFVSVLIILTGVFMLLPVFGVSTSFDWLRPYLGILLIIMGALLAYANITNKVD